MLVSIHTPTQGVTISRLNSHSNNWVSIHTPTQGVTWQFLKVGNYGKCFNPHTHAGCDNSVCVLQDNFCGFNPHTHAGCDLNIKLKAEMKKRFNPHTHAGCDPSHLQPIIDRLVSIHTPTQGVTILIDQRFAVANVSIHTPTQGVTFRLCFAGQLLRFQSTHPRRV